MIRTLTCILVLATFTPMARAQDAPAGEIPDAQLMKKLDAAAKRFRRNFEELPLREEFATEHYSTEGKLTSTKKGTYDYTFESSASPEERDIRRHAKGSKQGERDTGLIEGVILAFEAEAQPNYIFHFVPADAPPGMIAVSYTPRHPEKVAVSGNYISSIRFSGSARGELIFDARSMIFLRATSQVVGLPAERRMGFGFHKIVLKELRIEETFQELLPKGDKTSLLAPRSVTATTVTNRSDKLRPKRRNPSFVRARGTRLGGQA